jgi:hypothetical protein
MIGTLFGACAKRLAGIASQFHADALVLARAPDALLIW